MEPNKQTEQPHPIKDAIAAAKGRAWPWLQIRGKSARRGPKAWRIQWHRFSERLNGSIGGVSHPCLWRTGQLLFKSSESCQNWPKQQVSTGGISCYFCVVDTLRNFGLVRDIQNSRPFCNDLIASQQQIRDPPSQNTFRFNGPRTGVMRVAEKETILTLDTRLTNSSLRCRSSFESLLSNPESSWGPHIRYRLRAPQPPNNKHIPVQHQQHQQHQQRQQRQQQLRRPSPQNILQDVKRAWPTLLQFPELADRLPQSHRTWSAFSNPPRPASFQVQNHRICLRPSFGEGQKGLYTFQNTSEGTLARFIEWAYTADYPAIIKPTEAEEPTAVKPEPAQINRTKDDSMDGPDEKTLAGTNSGPNLTQENHPLLSHIRLYIFCSIYVIPDLQKLAFDRATKAFTELNQPTTLDTQLAVTAAMRVSFRKLLPNDQLLDWLAQYAAYNVAHLRIQRGFHDLLQESPTLASRMVLSLKPTGVPPWEGRPPKYEFAHYAPDYHYDDGYD